MPKDFRNDPAVYEFPEGLATGTVLSAEVEAGFTIDAERSDLLAAAILATKADPEEAAARAHAGRVWVNSEFVRDDLARKMLGFVERITGEAA